MIDEHKVAYETILSIAKNTDKKQTVIVKGGPGTGKSVVSLNAFGHLLQYGKNINSLLPMHLSAISY